MASNSTSGGIGFTGLLTIVFIVLKLIGYIDWSWWWVVSPIWIPIAIYFSFILPFFVIDLFKLLKKLILHK